ncbi:MAG: hypothetical protein V4563_01245 [Pseudomonadota bacterium]
MRFPRFGELFRPLHGWLVYLLVLTALSSGQAQAATHEQNKQWKSPSGAVLSYGVYPSQGRNRLLWMGAEYGEQRYEQAAAKYFAAHGVEVWLVDSLSAYDLPDLRSSRDKVPASDMQALLQFALQDGKQLALAGAGTNVIPLLNGVQLLQQAEQAQNAKIRSFDAVLIYPDLIKEVDTGAALHFLPATSHVRLNIALLQPQQSPRFWWLDKLKDTLQRGGSKVSIRVLPGVRDGFYERPNQSQHEMNEAKKLGKIMFDAWRKLVTDTST